MQFNLISFLIIFTISLAIDCMSDDQELNSENYSLTNYDNDSKKFDYYDTRYYHTVAEGVQKALDECRDKFKWERWNCPKKAFLDILFRSPLPSNKEMGLTRALIASGIVLSLTRSCSYASNNVCGCGQPTTLSTIEPIPSKSKFDWRGCDESIKFGFRVSKIYLEQQDVQQNEASRKINAHNYEVGRLAVKKNMKKVCKCHGPSASCQYRTCWTTVPDMAKIGQYIKRQYRLAAKVGAMSAEDTNVVSLTKELKNINQDKLVFADASPDYCYENAALGINGTLGRYCSIPEDRPNSTAVSRAEKDSCDRLCTKCGYKVKEETLSVEEQCNCRFVYCCSVQCQKCKYEKVVHKCVRHS